MLAGTGRDPGPVPSHEGPVLSHPIPQRSDPIPVPVPCQAWTGSSHPGLVPSHPGPTPGRDGTRTGYPGPGGQPRTNENNFVDKNSFNFSSDQIIRNNKK